MSTPLKQKAYKWLIDSRSLPKKEIEEILELADDQIVSSFLRITKLKKRSRQSFSAEDKEDTFTENQIPSPAITTTYEEDSAATSNETDIKEKDKFAEVKFLLQQAGPTALKYKTNPRARNVDMETVEGISSYISFKFEQISFGNHRVLFHYVEVSQGLKILMTKSPW
jgi:hypothetical protein